MTETVTLKKGYVDQEGEAHRKVTLRCPTMGDEIAAERAAREAGHGVDTAYFQIAFIRECITHWDGIPEPEITHMTALHRHDVGLLQQAIRRLEASDIDAEGNTPGDED